jgi:hypothetical protein
MLARPLVRKVVVVAGAILLGIALLYGVGVNLLLRTGGLEALLNTHPDHILIRYDRASTLWWGRVHVEGLEVRARDAHVEWQLRIDSADAGISLFALLSRRLHVTWLRGDGVAFRLRPRLVASEATADRIASIPKIVGFSDPPLLDPPGVANPGGKGFIIDLDGIVASHVREVWIDRVRVAGDLHIRGGFQLGPDGRLELSPSHLDVANAELSAGGDPILTNLDGELDAQIDATDLHSVKHTEILRSVTSSSTFHGRAHGPRFLRHFFDGSLPGVPCGEPTCPGVKPLPVEFDGGDGDFEGTLRVDHGIVRPPSHTHLALRGIHAGFAGWTLSFNVRADSTVVDDDAGTSGRLDTELADVAFAKGTEEGAGGKGAEAESALTIERVGCSAAVLETDLAKPPEDATFDCDVHAARARDLRTLFRPLASSHFSIDGGEATLSAKVKGSTKWLTAQADLASSVALHVEGAPLRSTVNGRVETKARFETREIDLDGTRLELLAPAIAGGAPASDWRGEVGFTPARIHLAPSSFDAVVTLRASDGRPFLALYRSMRETSTPVRAALSILPDPLIESMTAGMHGTAHLRVTRDGVGLHGLAVDGAAVLARAELDVEGGSKNGGIYFKAGPVAAGVAFTGTTTSPVLVNAGSWYATVVRARAH